MNRSPNPDKFPAAPWPPVLKVSSAIVTLFVGAVGYGAFRVIPPRGPEHVVGSVVAVVVPILLVASIFFIVTGYAIDGRTLYVRRMLWSTRVGLEGLRSVRRDPDAIKRSIRLFGNGGLYSFSGVYRSRSLGRYRLFATDPERAVVLTRSDGVVVITPADPDAFIERVRLRFPAARENPNGESRSTPHQRTHPIS